MNIVNSLPHSQFIIYFCISLKKFSVGYDDWQDREVTRDSTISARSPGGDETESDTQLAIFLWSAVHSLQFETRTYSVSWQEGSRHLLWLNQVLLQQLLNDLGPVCRIWFIKNTEEQGASWWGLGELNPLLNFQPLMHFTSLAPGSRLSPPPVPVSGHT